MNYILNKPVIFIVSLLPLLLLFWNGINQSLGVNPAETILDTMGNWALYFLIITLSVSPVRKIAKWNGLVRFRRMLGLYVFFYACLHMLSYIWFDQYFDWNAIIKDIIKRPFITLGFISVLILLVLAITSTTKMKLRLKQNWKKLHQLVYPVSIMVVIHYFLMTRADFTQPILMAVLLSVLLGYRLIKYLKSE